MVTWFPWTPDVMTFESHFSKTFATHLLAVAVSSHLHVTLLFYPSSDQTHRCHMPILPYWKQESPAIADKPARCEILPKLLQFGVPTTLSLTILAYLHAFNYYCVRNPEKFTENSNLWSSRSSKVIDLGANRKPICDLLLVINSNLSRICYRFRDIHG